MRRTTEIFAMFVFLILNSNLANAGTDPVVRKVRGGYCIAANSKASKYVPALKSGSSYSKMSKSNSKYNSLKSACSGLLAAGSLKFSKLPSTAEILASSQSAQTIGASATSGTPPTITELGSGDATSVYFVPDMLTRLLAGTPTESDCLQVFSSNVDGASGGMSACRSAQNVGEAMGNLLQSETTACYMKNFPAVAAANNQVGSVIQGNLPRGGWRSLFDTPESTDRLVKIVVAGGGGGDNPESSEEGQSVVYIKVKSANGNLASGNQYKAEFFACEGDAQPQEAQTISITSTNTYRIVSVGQSPDGGIFSSSVSGRVISEAGNLVFSPDAPRTLDLSLVNEQSHHFFKNHIEISNGQLSSKNISNFGDGVSKNFAIANYSGDSVPELRFLDGAFKDSFLRGADSYNFEGGIEYRDTGYRAAPGSDLVSELPVDFSDSFFASEPSTPQESSFNCNTADPDLTISLDMSNEAMQEVRNICESNRFESHDFCQTDGMQAIHEAYFQYCLN